MKQKLNTQSIKEWTKNIITSVIQCKNECEIEIFSSEEKKNNKQTRRNGPRFDTYAENKNQR